MKTKTIEKVITRKFNDFVESITCDHTRKLVRDNSIITGGCISSMLLREPVNDYDIYFTNRLTTAAVANYYTNKIASEAEVIEHDDKVEIFIKSSGIYNAPDEDLDLEEVEILNDDLFKESTILDKKERYSVKFISSNAITLSDGIQIITRFFGTPAEIHSNFDFVHCMNYWTSNERRVVLNHEALETLLTKELRYRGSKYPLCSILRTRKFIQRGWTINAGQYLKMALQLNEMDLLNIDVLKDQLTGVDSAYFDILISAIKGKSREDLNTYYLIDIINKIF